VEAPLFRWKPLKLLFFLLVALANASLDGLLRLVSSHFSLGLASFLVFLGAFGLSVFPFFNRATIGKSLT
jgi:hypothetical protein